MNIKQSAETFLKNLGAEAESVEHKVVSAFAEFLNSGVEAEHKAIALLQAAGYIVTPPAKAVTQAPAATLEATKGD